LFNKNIKTNRQKHFYIDGSLSNFQSSKRHIEKTKISQHDLERLDRLLFKTRDTTADLAKIKLELVVSPRKIHRYIKSLGWNSLEYNLFYLAPKSWPIKMILAKYLELK